MYAAMHISMYMYTCVCMYVCKGLTSKGKEVYVVRFSEFSSHICIDLIDVLALSCFFFSLGVGSLFDEVGGHLRSWAVNAEAGAKRAALIE